MLSRFLGFWLNKPPRGKCYLYVASMWYKSSITQPVLFSFRYGLGSHALWSWDILRYLKNFLDKNRWVNTTSLTLQVIYLEKTNQPPNKTVASPQALRARQLASAVHQHEPCRIRPWGCVSARSEKNTLRAHGNEGHNAWRVSYHIVPSFASIVIQIHSKGHKKQGWQS